MAAGQVCLVEGKLVAAADPADRKFGIEEDRRGGARHVQGVAISDPVGKTFGKLPNRLTRIGEANQPGRSNRRWPVCAASAKISEHAFVEIADPDPPDA